MSHEHVVVVRFSETDGQGVVFNGSYPVYADCAFRRVVGAGDGERLGVDVRAKRGRRREQQMEL